MTQICRAREAVMLGVLALWLPRIMDAFVRVAKALTT
jgi:hypothetical protein